MNIRILISFFIISNITLAQNKSDSLQSIWKNEKVIDSSRYNALEKHYDIYRHSQPDSTLIVLDYYYKLAKQKDATRQLFRAANKKGNIYRLKGNLDESLKSYQEATTYAIKLNNPVLEATTIGNIGNIFLNQQNYKEATQYYSKALKTFQEEKDDKGESRMLLALGSVYLTIDNHDLALEYYNKSLEISNNNNIKNTGTAINFMNVGLIHYEKERYNNAINSFKKALKILEVKNQKFFIAGCYKLLGLIHLKLNQLDQASFYANKNLEINKDLNIERGTVEALLVIAQIAYETNVDEAAKKAETVLKRLTPKMDKDLKKEVYELLYKCYKEQNKLDLSLKMHESYTIYNDSIQLEKNNFAVAREAVKNEFDNKLHETQLKNEKKQAQLELKQLKITFGIISGAALLILCIIFYYRNHIKKNRIKRDALLKELEEIKNSSNSNLVIDSNKFELIREDIEISIDRKLNETDWKVLTILLDSPEITNKEIATKAFMSVDGIGSALRRMYDYFNIKETKYKKIALLTEAIKRSNK